ncbi:uncharacterized protein TNCV_1355871 [Trichonephila clavipes]|uniref:Secreted protein n=1 Tax=Trichonephila clavipes TaxID=2585209 RepID=A0A8X6S7D0_TRICX|nr:uncharacterized protein TNCV_1355871 [Trichonephila clavipes]
MLQCQSCTLFLLLVGELLRNPSGTHLPKSQPVVNNYPHGSIAHIHLQRQHSQCDTRITSHLIVHLVDEIARDDSVCLVWSLVITHTLTACTKTGTPFSDRLVRDTFLPVNGHHSPMNSCRFLTFRCQKSDNTSLLLNRRILERERYPVLIRTAASFGRRFYKSFCSLLRA